MKLYDFDGMFDEKLAEYVAKNGGKYKENEWEDIIPKLYRKFGDTVIKSIGKTPREFYAEMTDERLIKCLRAHLKQDVPVSEFLCEAIEGRQPVSLLTPLLDGSDSEREYAMSLIGADDGVIGKYMQMLVSTDDGDLKDRCAELIKERADLASGEALENYKKGVCPECMLEILSRTTVKSDEIFNALLTAFRTDDENVPMHASYLAAYGDDRALDYLTDKIDEEGISFVEFRELKFAIEALGGEYTKKRDFSDDPYYKLINPNG